VGEELGSSDDVGIIENVGPAVGGKLGPSDAFSLGSAETMEGAPDGNSLGCSDEESIGIVVGVRLGEDVGLDDGRWDNEGA